MLKEMDPNGQRTLFLAGANEFLMPEGSMEQTPDVLASPFAKAYEMLGYDRVYCTAREAAWLEKNSGPLPSFLHPVGEEVGTDIISVGNSKIGLVLFPELEPDAREPRQSTLREIKNAAKELRPEVNLLIGMSPWGISLEQQFLNTSDPVFDIILGAGPGRGLVGELSQTDSVLWARAYSKGKYLQFIHVFAWPDPGHNPKLVLEQNVAVEIKPLDEETPEVREIRKLFENAGF